MGSAAATAAAMRLAEVQVLLHSSRGRGERLPAALPVPAGAGRTAAVRGGKRSGRAWRRRRRCADETGLDSSRPATEAAAEATGEPTRGPERCGLEQPPRAAPRSRGSGGRLARR